MSAEQIALDDVIQLDPEHCRWGPLLCIVDEVRSWGVLCYAVHPSEQQNECMFLRVKHEHYVYIGHAEWASRPKPQPETPR